MKALIIGLLISFSGSLPLGNLNLAAMQLAAYENLKKALWFSLGVAIVEIIYLSISFTAVQWITGHTSLFNYLQWSAVVLLLAMGISAFIASRKPAGEKKNIVLDNKLPRFILGALMSAVNPIQIPFWGGWVVYALSNHWIDNSLGDAACFITGAGLGTYGALLAFMIAGKKLSAWLIRNYKRVQLSMCIIFLLLALFQGLKLTGII